MSNVRSAASVAGLLVLSIVSISSGQAGPAETEKTMSVTNAELKLLHDAYVQKYRPLVLESEQAWWAANTTGSDEAVARRERAERALVELHSDRAVFAKLKALKESGKIETQLDRRVLETMYNHYLPGQADVELQKQVVALEVEVEQIFNTHRGVVNGQPRTENELRRVLARTTDSAEAEAAWKAYLAIGGKVEAKLKKLVQLRNQIARQLGFRDYFAMRLALEEIEEADLLKLFEELDQLTREPFAALKADIDKQMAARFGITPAELRPWHFGEFFFQESPQIETVSLDDLIEGKDLLELARTYYTSLGMPVEGHPVSQRSLREGGQEPARLLRGPGSCRRRSYSDEPQSERVLAGHAAARAGARGVRPGHWRGHPLRYSPVLARPDHRGHRLDVWGHEQERGVAGEGSGCTAG